MYSATTPIFLFKPATQVDLSAVNKIWATFSTPEQRQILTKTGEDVQINRNIIQVFLTQEDSLLLPRGKVKVQLNWLFTRDGREIRACSKKFIINVESNLKEEVLYASDLP